MKLAHCRLVARFFFSFPRIFFAQELFLYELKIWCIKKDKIWVKNEDKLFKKKYNCYNNRASCYKMGWNYLFLFQWTWSLSILCSILDQYFVDIFNYLFIIRGKVHIFWEGHKILRNLHRRFVLCKGQ